jgi:hypothetical protein
MKCINIYTNIYSMYPYTYPSLQLPTRFTGTDPTDEDMQHVNPLFVFKCLSCEVPLMIDQVPGIVVTGRTFVKVNCTNAFTVDERTFLTDLNLQTLDDLLTSPFISDVDKSRMQSLYHYVCHKYELAGLEPFNGNKAITLHKTLYNVRTSIDKQLHFLHKMQGSFEDYTLLKLKPWSHDRFCEQCGRSDIRLKQCDGCKAIHYCGKDCQRQHWKMHKPICKITKSIHIKSPKKKKKKTVT